MFLERLKKGREYVVAVACMMLPNAYKFGFGRDQEPLDAWGTWQLPWCVRRSRLRDRKIGSRSSNNGHACISARFFAARRAAHRKPQHEAGGGCVRAHLLDEASGSVRGGVAGVAFRSRTGRPIGARDLSPSPHA
jgi:hypothetical protein